MSHISIILSRAAPSPTEASADSALDSVSYEYKIPVPHDATPAQVGEMVRKAFRRLEGNAED